MQGARVELLQEQFQVCSQEEIPSVCSEVGHHGLLVAVGHDLQGLVLNHLKFVQVSGRHLGETDRDSGVDDGTHNDLVCQHQSLSQKEPA